MRCKCRGKGLVKICYQSGEVFDIAICHCRAGEIWRSYGSDAVRKRFNLPDEHQIGLLEEFDGETPTARQNADFMAAGRTQKAKL